MPEPDAREDEERRRKEEWDFMLACDPAGALLENGAHWAAGVGLGLGTLWLASAAKLGAVAPVALGFGVLGAAPQVIQALLKGRLRRAALAERGWLAALPFAAERVRYSDTPRPRIEVQFADRSHGARRAPEAALKEALKQVTPQGGCDCMMEGRVDLGFQILGSLQTERRLFHDVVTRVLLPVHALHPIESVVLL